MNLIDFSFFKSWNFMNTLWIKVRLSCKVRLFSKSIHDWRDEFRDEIANGTHHGIHPRAMNWHYGHTVRDNALGYSNDGSHLRIWRSPTWTMIYPKRAPKHIRRDMFVTNMMGWGVHYASEVSTMTHRIWLRCYDSNRTLSRGSDEDLTIARKTKMAKWVWQ